MEPSRKYGWTLYVEDTHGLGNKWCQGWRVMWRACDLGHVAQEKVTIKYGVITPSGHEKLLKCQNSLVVFHSDADCIWRVGNNDEWYYHEWMLLKSWNPKSHNLTMMLQVYLMALQFSTVGQEHVFRILHFRLIQKITMYRNLISLFPQLEIVRLFLHFTLIVSGKAEVLVLWL